MKITTVGIDLAKNVFQIHAVDQQGKAALRKQLRRDQMTAFFVNLPACLIGMEACGRPHQGQRREAAAKVRMYGCNRTFMSSSTDCLAFWGRPCTDTQSKGSAIPSLVKTSRTIERPFSAAGKPA